VIRPVHFRRFYVTFAIMELNVYASSKASFEVQHSAPFSMDTSGVKPRLRLR
jgi:hypothetical protein